MVDKTIRNEYGEEDHKKLTEAIDKAQQDVSFTSELISFQKEDPMLQVYLF